MSQRTSSQLSQEMRAVLERWRSESPFTSGASYDPGKGKPTNSEICVSTIGIFLFNRKKSKKKSALQLFMSYMDIESIGRNDEGDLEFTGRDGSCLATINVDSVSEFLTSMQKCFAAMMNGSGLKLQLKGGLRSAPPPEEVGPNNVSLKYLSMCAKWKWDVDPDLLAVFSEFEKGSRRMICFGKELAPTVPWLIGPPLYYEKDLRVLVLDGFAPMYLGLILQDILSANHYITSCTLSSYDSNDLCLETVRLQDIQNLSVVSWTLSNLDLNVFAWSVLWSMFRYAAGAIQQFTVHKVAMDSQKIHDLNVSILDGHAFRTLESLTLEEIEIQAGDVVALYSCVSKLPGALPMLSKIVCRKWSSGLGLRQDATQSLGFVSANSLRHLYLSRTIMKDITGPVDFPKELRVIEFPMCAFTAASLVNILSEIAKKVTKPLTLNLESIQMGAAERTLFFQKLPLLPAMSQLIEFDWSHSPIPEAEFDDWARVFLVQSLRFIGLSRCFRTSNKNMFYRIINKLETCDIWGILFAGPLDTDKGTDLDWADDIAELLSKLTVLKGLTYLNISRHKFTKSLIPWMSEFCKKVPSFQELECDNSGLATLTDLHKFYEGLLSPRRLQAVRRPVTDLKRLMGKDFESKLRSPEYSALVQLFEGVREPSGALSRRFFYATKQDMSKLADYHDQFPFSLSSYRPGEYVDFAKIKNQLDVRSVMDPQMQATPAVDFAEHQASILPTPYEMPPKSCRIPRFRSPAFLKAAGPYVMRDEPDLEAKERNVRHKRHSEKRKSRRHRSSSKKILTSLVNEPESYSHMGNVSDEVIQNICIITELFELYANGTDAFQIDIQVEQPEQYISPEGMKWIEEKKKEKRVEKDEPTDGPIEESSEQFSRYSSRFGGNMTDIMDREELLDTCESEHVTEEFLPDDILSGSQIDMFESLDRGFQDDYLDDIPSYVPMLREKREDEITDQFQLLPPPPTVINTAQLFSGSVSEEKEVCYDEGYTESLLKRVSESKHKEALQRLDEAYKVLVHHIPWRDMNISNLPRDPTEVHDKGNISREFAKLLDSNKNLYAAVINPREIRRSMVQSYRKTATAADLELEEVDMPTVQVSTRTTSLGTGLKQLNSSTGSEEDREGLNATHGTIKPQSRPLLQTIPEAGQGTLKPRVLPGLPVPLTGLGNMRSPKLPIPVPLSVAEPKGDAFAIADSTPAPGGNPESVPPAPDRISVTMSLLQRSNVPPLE